DSVTIDNRFGGSIAGERGDGVNLDEIGDNATILNIAGTIRGDDDGIKISDVDDDVRIDNRFGGSITGHDGNGVSVEDVGDAAIIKNSMFGSITGHDDGVYIRDVDDGVFVDNRFGGEIKGSRGDGVDIQDVDDSVV